MIAVLANDPGLKSTLEELGYYTEHMNNAPAFLQRTNDTKISIALIDVDHIDALQMIEYRKQIRTLKTTSFIFLVNDEIAPELYNSIDPILDDFCRKPFSKELLHFRIKQSHRIRNFSIHQENHFVDNLKRAVGILPYPYALFDPNGNLTLSNQSFADTFPFLTEYLTSKENDIWLYAQISFQQLMERSCADKIMYERSYKGQLTDFIFERILNFEKKKFSWTESFASGLENTFSVNRCEEDFTTLIIKNHEPQEAHELSKLAFEDPLTGLANRSRFFSLLEKSIRHHDPKTDKAAGVVIIDLDDFKFINDTFGHPVGDELLKEIATRLKGAVRYRDTVARLGGDEFAIILEQLGGSENADLVIERLSKAVKKPFNAHNITILPKASFGFALSPHHALSIDDLLKHADLAMYASKNEKSRLFG